MTYEPWGRSVNKRSECESLMTGDWWALWSPWHSHSDTLRHTAVIGRGGNGAAEGLGTAAPGEKTHRLSANNYNKNEIK